MRTVNTQDLGLRITGTRVVAYMLGRQGSRVNEQLVEWRTHMLFINEIFRAYCGLLENVVCNVNIFAITWRLA
jgi:hypothetical protein